MIARSAPRPAGMLAFSLVWLGQVLSLFGTGLARFALTIWAWQLTGQATALALVAFFSLGPELVFSPVAGVLIDRWNRRLVMMLSDLAAGLATLAILALYLLGRLEIWHLYAAAVVEGAFGAFQWPAFSAALSTMLPREQLGRANGMMTLVDTLPAVLAPLAAGALIGVIGLGGILLIDVFTFSFALGTLLWVHIPQPARTAHGQAGRGSVWGELRAGVRYLWARPGLFWFESIFMAGNTLYNFCHSLIAPFILLRTSDDSRQLGLVVSAAALGEVLGGAAVSAWGGPRRRVAATLWGWVLMSFIGHGLLGLGRSLPFWLLAAFAGAFTSALISLSQVIWQTKVPPDLQGRIFGVRRTMQLSIAPLAVVLGGLLADRVFTPGMQPGGALVPLFGGLVGTGPGAGVALVILLGGVGGALAGFSGFLIPAVRRLEQDLPDMPAAAEAIPAD